MSLSSLNLDGVTVQSDQQPSVVNETSLAVVAISTLNKLTRLSINQWRFSDDDVVDLAKSIRDKSAANLLELSLKNVPWQTCRLLAKAAEESGRVSVTRAGCVYRFKKTQRAPGFLNKVNQLITSSWNQ